MNSEQVSQSESKQEIDMLRRELARKNEIVKEYKLARDHLDERLQFEQLLLDLSATFVNLPAADVEASIQHGLQQIVEFLDIDRSTFFVFPDGQSMFLAIASYAGPGFKTVPLISLSENFPWAVERFKRGEPVCWATLDDLPEEAVIDRQSFRTYKLRSNANIPIFCEGAVQFTLSVGSIRKEREWPEELIPRLRLLGEIFTNALLRKRKDDRLKQLREGPPAESASVQTARKSERAVESIIGRSPSLHYALYRMQQVAPTTAPVLIQGETGTGKELVARAIHQASLRSERALVQVNCAALSTSLIESELFGHEKGAFTGASTIRKGRFEAADGATLFLDAIGELPLDLQPKLLQALEYGEFERLGSSHSQKVDVRILAATNRELEQEVLAGRFREDLWHRLNVFSITIPPLRDRQDDIPLLVSSFVDTLNVRLGKKVTDIPQQLLNDLQAYPWPGNVRELQNVIERAMILAHDEKLRIIEPLNVSRPAPEHNGTSTSFQIDSLQTVSQQQTLEEVEREYIVRILEKTYWRVNGPQGAAKILGLNPNTLRGRMRKLGIQRPKAE